MRSTLESNDNRIRNDIFELQVFMTITALNLCHTDNASTLSELLPESSSHGRLSNDE